MKSFDWQKFLVVLVVVTLAIGGAFYLLSLEQPETTLYVPIKDLPAYYLLDATDLMTMTLPTTVLPSDPLTQEPDLVGRYTNQPLTAESPVVATQLVPAVDEKYVMNTTAVSIPATAAMIYNGQLISGDIVTI